MKRIFATFTLLFITAVGLFAQEAQRKTHFNLASGLAIQGYDPVAYFTKNAAVKGKKEFAIYHQGVTYYFSSAENKELFKSSPARYEPEYGGWCAYAMGAKGEKVEVDPETFKVVNGKLYLFYNKYFTNTLKSWNKDENNLRTKADANWIKIFH